MVAAAGRVFQLILPKTAHTHGGPSVLLKREDDDVFLLSIDSSDLHE